MLKAALQSEIKKAKLYKTLNNIINSQKEAENCKAISG